jgi:molybdate transport system substrate-binding protein
MRLYSSGEKRLFFNVRRYFMKKLVFSLSVLAITVFLFSDFALLQAAPGGDAESILVYSGAGMRKPMDQIGMAFQKKYGTKVKYNYAGSQALLSQMELTKSGDAYMPGETMYIEIAARKGLVGYQKLTCYHIPIITVPKGNPANIKGLKDLARPGVRLIFGDPKVAAIGITAKQILEKNGLYEKAWKNVIATAPTMNEVMVLIALGQADASINWWDTVKSAKDIQVIEIAQEQNIIEVVPIGVATFSKHPETARKLVDFCASAEGLAIFEQHGFIPYPNPKYPKK